MLKKPIFALALLVAASTAAQAQSTPAKKELVARILKVQQPGIEATARGLVEQPAMELMDNAASALPARVAKDKQEAVAKEIQADVQKYVEDAFPVVRDRAVKLAPSTIGTLLEEKFTEDELKQVVSIMESPVYVKFQRMGSDMQKVLIDKVVADTRGTIEPKVRTLEQTVAKRLGVTTAPGAPNAAAKPAKPAAKPATK
jgi:uncharacterized protein YqgV (UPF0045/DUF77 family)